MDDRPVHKNCGNPRRYSKRSKALAQLLDLFSARRPLSPVPINILARSFSKWFRMARRFTARHTSHGLSLPRDEKPHSPSPVNCADSKQEVGTGPLVGFRCRSGIDNASQPIRKSRSCATYNRKDQLRLQTRRRGLSTSTLSSSEGRIPVDLEICGSSMSQKSPFQALYAEVSRCGGPDSILYSIRELYNTHMSQEWHAEALQQNCRNSEDHQQEVVKGLTENLEDAGATIQGLRHKGQSLATYAGYLEEHLRQKHDEIQTLKEHLRQKHDEIQTLNDTIDSLQSKALELQNVSQEHQACLKSKVADSERHELRNANSGAYEDETARPFLLGTALSCTKIAITRFQKAFVEAIRSRRDPASIVDLLNPDAFYARPNHINYAIRGAVYEVFFEGFENESFNTSFGVSKYLNPNLRQTNFYECYVRQRDHNGTGSEDPQFEEFCQMKISPLWKKFNLRCGCVDSRCMNGRCLNSLGGRQLVSSFRTAAKSVWLLHKLAFSFEPPAAIFRIESGIDIDPNYMESVVNLEDSKKFVQKVGFMISPGLRVRSIVLRSEVYLSGEGVSADFDGND